MFKKMLVLFLALLTFISCYFTFEKPIFKDYSGDYTLYVNSNSSNAIMVDLSDNSYPLVFNKTGESVCFESSDFELQTLLNKYSAKLIFTEKIEDGICYYAFSPKIKYQKIVNGSKINLHVFIGEGRVVLGAPVIFGSF